MRCNKPVDASNLGQLNSDEMEGNLFCHVVYLAGLASSNFFFVAFQSMEKVSISDITSLPGDYPRPMDSSFLGSESFASGNEGEEMVYLNIFVTKRRKSEWKDDIKKVFK